MLKLVLGTSGLSLIHILRVLSKAQTPPFEIVDDTNTNEELRLKYRYLDLRRRPLLNNLMMRRDVYKRQV